MLIPYETVKQKVNALGISIKGVLHIGAHECEELNSYVNNGVPADKIDWVDANPAIVNRMKARGIHVHNAAISDVEAELPFYITNNGQSSSLLEFGTHEKSYPWCKVVGKIIVKTQTLSNFIEKNQIHIQERNFWTLDIQGVELSALKSAGSYIDHADVIFTEVNIQEVYKGGCLLSEIDDYLKTKGLIRIDTSMTGEGWGDALYVRMK
jgi:FkbM family methyltransferase